MIYYPTWLEARTAAIARAETLQIAQGIEYSKYDKAYTVKCVPAPRYRTGWETRCEVVEIGQRI